MKKANPLRCALGVLIGAGVFSVGLPASVDAAGEIPLRPGESTTLGPSLAVPSLPPKLDFVVLMDTTGSMGDAISNAKNGAVLFDDAVVAEVPDANFAVASFEDYPTAPYGGTGPNGSDQPYRLHTDLTANQAIFGAAVNSMTIRFGNDPPDAAVTALHEAATGTGIAGTGGATVPPGSDISFREGAAHYLALISDSPFHNDPLAADTYTFSPTPSYATMIEALASDEVRVITEDLSSTGVEPDMSSLATDTDGAYDQGADNGVAIWADTGAQGVEGILGAMRDITFPAAAQASCEPLQVSLDPSSWPGTLGEDVLATSETITAPQGVSEADLPPGGVVACDIAYSWGDVAIGSTQAAVQVILPSATELQVAKTARKLRATGSVAPAHPGEEIDITLSRKMQGGAYQPIATKAVTLTGASIFRAVFPRPTRGRCEVEAVFPGDADHDPSDGKQRFRC